MTNAVNLASAAGTGFAFRNRIINGDMRLDQFNSGAAVANSGNYFIDMWADGYNGSGRYTAQRVSEAPSGFVFSAKHTVTTAVTPASGDWYQLYTGIEGANIADAGWGTASAVPVTVSFWVRSSIAGLYSFRICNGAVNRSYVATYTINATNTWEYKTITIPGDTTGTWPSGTDCAMYVVWDQGSGTTMEAASANTWYAGNYYRVAGTVRLISTNGATFNLTGVQLEIGTAATPFEERFIGLELGLCERYYQICEGGYQGPAVNGQANAGKIQFRTIMRAAPTITWLSNLRAFGFGGGSAASLYMNTDQTKYAHPFRIGNATQHDGEFWDRFAARATL